MKFRDKMLFDAIKRIEWLERLVKSLQCQLNDLSGIKDATAQLQGVAEDLNSAVASNPVPKS